MEYFGKSCFELKLEAHGVNVKLDKTAKRSLYQISQISPMMLKEELELLTIEKLTELQKALMDEMNSIKKEMAELQEENLNMTTKNEVLTSKSKDLAENVKKVLRPWINRYPNSDELTRAYLIN